MIAERFPELLRLSSGEKLQLAEELYSTVFAGKARLTDEEIYAELNQSLTEYHADPNSGSTWEEVKARILARRSG
jgi:putative addiction module component (TIGR02574 family)